MHNILYSCMHTKHIYMSTHIYGHTYRNTYILIPPFSLLKWLFSSQTAWSVLFPWQHLYSQTDTHKPMFPFSCDRYLQKWQKKLLHFWRLSRGINSVTRKQARLFGLYIWWKMLQNTHCVWYSKTLVKWPCADNPLQMPDSGVSLLTVCTARAQQLMIV